MCARAQMHACICTRTRTNARTHTQMQKAEAIAQAETHGGKTRPILPLANKAAESAGSGVNGGSGAGATGMRASLKPPGPWAKAVTPRGGVLGCVKESEATQGGTQAAEGALSSGGIEGDGQGTGMEGRAGAAQDGVAGADAGGSEAKAVYIYISY